jgi:hypothetical protein
MDITSCDGIATLDIFLEGVSDDRTPVEEMGFEVRVVEGETPLGFSPSGRRSLRFGPMLTFNADHRLDLTLGLRLVDKAGNESEEVLIAIDEDDGGCAIGGPERGLAPLALGISLLLLTRRRR